MATTARPGVDPDLLRSRLAGLRRRLRFVVLRRGIGWLLTAVLLGAVVTGLLDWHWHLPGLVRAVLLVVTLTAAVLIVVRYLLRPLAAPADDLALALRVEEHYPGLNDALASTVQFLEEPADSEARGSPALRREAVRGALRRVKGVDFGRVIDRRGVRLAGLSMLLSCGLAVALVVHSPAAAWTAFLRFANPFGGPDWPKLTLLDIDPPRARIGRNEPFELRGRVRGVIPDRASVLFQLDGLPQVEQVCEITRGEGEPVGTLLARLEPGRVQRNFTVQVRAGDAVSERYAVTVLPPPLLVPLHGRASPQVRLTYPGYTDLPDAELPDGSGNVEAVAGTMVHFAAAADRPLARAWVEYQPEPRADTPAAFLAPLGAQHPAEVLALAAGGQAVWDTVPARLDGDRRELSVDFVPRVSGLYALHFEDDNGLHGSRLFELRVLADPAPAVNLERPSASRDSLQLLPEGEFTLQVSAEDPMFAVRSVALEYRCGKDDRPRRLPLYDHAAAGAGISGALGVLALNPLPVPLPAPRLRLPLVQVGRRVALAELKHPDGSPLKEGDVLILQAAADDFDDVTVDKQPGRSHEVEIQVIGRNALEIALNKEQARIQQELVKLREQQREALKKVADAEPHWKRTGQLTPEEIDQLQQAEQLQQQIRERVGSTREEGLRAEVNRLLETLRDNRLPRSAVHERMEAVAGELDRLAREELERIEPRLTEVRKENQAPGQKDPELLTEARKHQEEVEKTLNDLLSRLEPWTSTQEIKGEAKAILQEQRQITRETEALTQQKDVRDKKPEELTPEQRAELERLQEAQQKLKERTNQLLEKMDRVAGERKTKDPETARELKQTAQLGRDDDITGDMDNARQGLQNNNLNSAARNQKEAARKLEGLAKRLEDRREDELDRLAKKLREIQQKMDKISEEQEQLQKRVKEAQAETDPAKREEELKRLAKKQAELKQRAEEMAEELKRLRAERASQSLAKAADQMGEALKQLERGDNADEQQEDALDRLDEAEDEMKRAADDAQEELAREQLGKIADQLKRLKERQEGLTAEASRLQQEAQQRKGWDRGRLASLRDLAAAQKGLGDETKKLAEDKLPDAAVFNRILRRAAEAMGGAAQHADDRFREALHRPQDTHTDEDIARLQQEATRRFDQLLDAIKPDPGVPQRRAAGGGGGGGGGGAGGGGDGIPPLAELKLVRTLQAEVKQRTEEFQRRHPDPNQLDTKGREELQSLHRDQREVSEMIDELGQPPENEKDKGAKRGDKP